MLMSVDAARSFMRVYAFAAMPPSPRAAIRYDTRQERAPPCHAAAPRARSDVADSARKDCHAMRLYAAAAATRLMRRARCV